MKTVALTIGPRGAGKSTYCRAYLAAHPEAALVSRDEILLELFGEASIDPYTDSRGIVLREIWRRVKKCFEEGYQLVILDCWNGWSNEREYLTKHLREGCGVEVVVAWRFITSEDWCLRWFLEKDNILRSYDGNREYAIRVQRRDFLLYNDQPVELDQGFNSIRFIDPLQQVLFW